jgi:hypothetical protein
MDDYSGLAARVAAGVAGLRGCLILSRDGLVLGAHPGDDETVAKPSWLKFATLGEPEKSFVEFPDQTWVYVHRGPYAAFAVAEAGVRPGLLIDQLEQALLIAEESRTKRDGLRAPEAASQPAGPRTTLHPTTTTELPEAAPVSVRPQQAGAVAGSPPARPPARPAPEEAPAPTSASRAPDAVPEAPTAPTVPEEAPPPEPPRHEKPKLMTTPVIPDRGPDDDEGESGEVDRVLLAQEFSGLLQDTGSDDEASS